VKSIHTWKSLIQKIYDNIKAHGELKVETREEDGAQFIINLPL